MTSSSPATGTSKALGLTSLILGIAGIVGLFIPFINFITLAGAVVGLILGILSRRREPGAKGLALTGIILSAIALVLGLIFIVVGVALVGSMMTDPSVVG